ncbi:ATP-binding protein (plasmid) [Halococcus dombrowskii]|uniref:site-specific DNA-methyltransferase (cytosine-N(4)-specific) n=1 Tax=Halococcus dombrowskii TaxID=179637 RepID=A0AAV3SD49_HALDO|nr:DNA methyltransferase [Halococcus dombrowskii]UOO96916.1 ATP-binding protein [Halococcus dombrowskii]
MTETCESTVELEMLASGMAKQHENYLDALQELIDNSVSAVVKSESYFKGPDESINLSLMFVRGQNTITTYISDNGPGITRNDLQNEVFRTGNKEISEGILNNVGWGLKASLAWFEESLKQRNIGNQRDWFTLITQTETSNCVRVDGPITDDLPIDDGAESDWDVGIPDRDTELIEANHGTRVHATCARDRFDNDVWPSADSLGTKVQYIRERLGVIFRRLLSAHDDNQIAVNYHDLETNQTGYFDVAPIWPEYDDDESKKNHEFEITTPDDKRYDIKYEAGTLDIDAMTAKAEEQYPELLTQSGKFRYRYRPSQNRQGIDIYANGRLLMTSVFKDIFKLTRNNQYNYFGGVLQIFPKGETGEVPTDNKKTRLDTNNELWRKIRDELSKDEFLPDGRDYRRNISSGGASKAENAESIDEITDTAVPPSTFDNDEEIFTMHNGDARTAVSELRTRLEEEKEQEEFLDATVTSPPYYDIKEYGSADDTEIGQHGSYVEYLNELREIFEDVYSITKEDGSLWVVVNTFRRNHELVQLPFDIARVCQNLDQGMECSNCGNTVLRGIEVLDEQGTACPHCGHTISSEDSWIFQDIIIWNKNKALPYTKKGRLRNVFEYVLCFSKSSDFALEMDRIRESHPSNFKQWWADFPERYHPLGKLPENIWEFEPPTRGSFNDNSDIFNHPAAFPPGLIERILTLSTDPEDVVMDPFSGSGVTVAQAEQMNRNGIGIDLNEKYCKAYPDLKQHLQEQQTPSEQSTTQEKLNRLICGLRQTKYARELIRTLCGEIGLSSPSQSDVHTVFLVSRELGYQTIGDDIHGEVDVLLIVGEETTAQNALQYHKSAEEATTLQPCSGFGMKARPIVLTTQELLAEMNDGTYTHLPENLYVYENGRHYVFTEEISWSDWAEMNQSTEWAQRYSNDEFPPILSNVGVDVDHPIQSMETLSRPSSKDHEFYLNMPSSEPIHSVIESR